MKSAFGIYFIRTFLFSLAIAAVAFIISVLASNIVTQIFYFILLYFFLLTLVFHYGLLRSSEGRPQQFVRYFMAATSFKLLIHIAVIISYSLLHRDEAMRFILSFFAAYLLFMLYEVRIAMSLNRRKSKAA